MTCKVDILIVGGGPAGATTGLLLARSGWSVAIVEKKNFPRPKVCGEFISAATLPLMQELGILNFYATHAGPAVQQVGLFAADTMLTSAMPPADNSFGKWGRALGREYLDEVLLNEARQAGAKIWQPWSASALEDKQTHFMCTVATKDKTAEIAAQLIIIANGSWERSVVKRPDILHSQSDLLAFKARFRNCILEHDLMPLISFPGGYGGLVHSDSEHVTLSCCIRRDVLQKIRVQNPRLQAGDAVLHYIKSTCVGVHRVLSSAYREGPWLSVGPLWPGIRRCYDNGIFYVGNIAGEAHPVIAEGISMAMQSAWLLSQLLFTLPQGRVVRKDLASIGRDYRKKWNAQFANRIRAAAFFAQMASRPQVMALLLPIIKRFPGLLTYGATLSGKIKEVVSPRHSC